MKEILERFSSPITGAFIATWCAWNWKIVLIAFTAGTNVSDKIILIQNESGWWLSLGLPLISSLFYLFVMPYLLLGYKIFTDYIFIKNSLKESSKNTKLSLLTDFQNATSFEILIVLFKQFESIKNEMSNAKTELELFEKRNQHRINISELNNLKNCIIQTETKTTQIKELLKKSDNIIVSNNLNRYGVDFNTFSKKINEIESKLK